MATRILLLLFLVFVTSCFGEVILPLSHILSKSDHGTSTHHLIKSSSVRSTLRHNNRNKNNAKEVSVPLSAGSDYTLTLSLGQNSSVVLYMDTGSDLVWFPCRPFECILCEGKTDKPINIPLPLQNSKSVRCVDESCSAAHSNLPSSDLCAISGCPLDLLETNSCPLAASRCPPFYYAYGDGSLIGRLRRGSISLSGISLPNFTFACAHSALAEPVGVAGFGRGVLSLPTQLSPTSLGSRFSYCLRSHSFRSEKLREPSPLILGRAAEDSSSSFIYTPILSNPKHPYLYSVGLSRIFVGNTAIDTDNALKSVNSNGNGGLAVDSGTTFTMLPSAMYEKVTTEFSAQMEREGFVRAEKAEAETGMRPCYYYSGGRKETRKVPEMGMGFVGGGRVDLPRRNYFIGVRRGVGCLMVMDGGDASESGGPAGVLGNFQQQGFEVVYDLGMEKVGFARRKCGGLWEEVVARGGRA